MFTSRIKKHVLLRIYAFTFISTKERTCNDSRYTHREQTFQWINLNGIERVRCKFYVFKAIFFSLAHVPHAVFLCFQFSIEPFFCGISHNSNNLVNMFAVQRLFASSFPMTRRFFMNVIENILGADCVSKQKCSVILRKMIISPLWRYIIYVPLLNWLRLRWLSLKYEAELKEKSWIQLKNRWNENERTKKNARFRNEFKSTV